MADRQDIFRWIEKPETRRIIDLFGSAEVEMRFVGGCVRDSLFGREIGDIDIATAARPEAVQEMLHNAGIKSVPTGIEHGTLTAIVDGQAFEITTYRRDVETDGRHAVVSFGTDWQEDAARRDFTINALSITPDGTLCDPLGGAADLKAGRIRFVGEARSAKIYCGFYVGSASMRILATIRRTRRRLKPAAGSPSGFPIYPANVSATNCCAFSRRPTRSPASGLCRKRT